MVEVIIDLLNQMLEQMVNYNEDIQEMKEDIAAIKESVQRQSDYI